MSGPNVEDKLWQLVRDGDSQALGDLFASHRARLGRLVRLRLDPRLTGRLDESDVLQDAFLDIQKRFDKYVAEPTMPLYLWMRFLTVQRIKILHRRHLGAAMRGARREVSLNRSVGPTASSVSLARLLMCRSAGISKAAMRAELQARVEDALNSLDPIDREVLVLRHFEELSNNETAAVLGLQKAAASNRYVRALARLRAILVEIPGLMPE